MKFFIFSLLLSITSFAKVDLDKIKWKVRKVKNGITLYDSDFEKDGLTPLRSSMYINAPIEKIMTVLGDAKRKPEWVPRMKASIIVHRFNELQHIELAQYNSPWPVKDREFLVKGDVKWDNKNKQLDIGVNSTSYEKAPRSDDFVRGEVYGRIILKPESDNLTYIDVVFIINPMGSIPKWIVNLVQSNWPYKYLDNLNERINDGTVKIRPDYIQIKNRFLKQISNQ